MHKGTIILVPFPFTDLSGHKVRPAIVLYSQNKGNDCVVCFVSSKDNEKIGTLDLKVTPTPQNGLKVDSVIKVTKLATLEKRIAIGEIGTLEKSVIKNIDSVLKKVFGL